MEFRHSFVGNLLVWKSPIPKNRKLFFIFIELHYKITLICFMFRSQPLADVVKHVEKGYRMEKPEGCPQEIHDLMRKAWDLNADLRPTFNQVKSQLAQLKDTPNFI